MAKHEYAKQILAAGFKVVVVEQVERVVETNQRKSEGNTGVAWAQGWPGASFFKHKTFEKEWFFGWFRKLGKILIIEFPGENFGCEN